MWRIWPEGQSRGLCDPPPSSYKTHQSSGTLLVIPCRCWRDSFTGILTKVIDTLAFFQLPSVCIELTNVFLLLTSYSFQLTLLAYVKLFFSFFDHLGPVWLPFWIPDTTKVISFFCVIVFIMTLQNTCPDYSCYCCNSCMWEESGLIAGVTDISSLYTCGVTESQMMKSSLITSANHSVLRQSGKVITFSEFPDLRKAVMVLRCHDRWKG